MKKKIDKKTQGQFLRFAMTGTIATAIHYSVYWLLLLVMAHTIAYTIGYVVSLVFNYILTSRFTFQSKTNVQNGIGFLGSHLINYTLQVTLLNIFVSMGISKPLAPIPVYCIAIPVNFFILKFVFNKTRGNK